MTDSIFAFFPLAAWIEAGHVVNTSLGADLSINHPAKWRIGLRQ